MKIFFETWKNFSFKVSDCLMFEWPALCNGIMLGKKFRDFFQFWLLFCGLQATVSDFGQKTSYCQIRLKKLHFPTKHLEKILKFSKIFFLNLFFRQLVIFSKLQLPSLWNRAWAISNFLPNLVVFDFAWRFSAKCSWIFPKSKFWLI